LQRQLALLPSHGPALRASTPATPLADPFLPGLPAPPHTGLGDKGRPWIKEFAKLPTAALPEPPAGLQRRRPFIYVYDMPPAYTSRMLQYRLDR
jgi:hypothetical protein